MGCGSSGRKGPGIVLGPVDAIGIGGERGEGQAFGRHGGREQELGVAPALALGPQGHGGFPAREQDHGPVKRAVAQGNLAGNRDVDAADVTGFALDGIRQYHGGNTLRFGGPGCGLQRQAGRGDDFHLMTGKDRIAWVGGLPVIPGQPLRDIWWQRNAPAGDHSAGLRPSNWVGEGSKVTVEWGLGVCLGPHAEAQRNDVTDHPSPFRIRVCACPDMRPALLPGRARRRRWFRPAPLSPVRVLRPRRR